MKKLTALLGLILLRSVVTSTLNKPTIAVRPDNQTVLIGADLILHCEPDLSDDDASTSSLPTITFTRHAASEDGSLLRDENNALVEETLQQCSIQGVCERLDATTGTYHVEFPTVLHLPNMRSEDSGWYTCQVWNEVGTSAASAHVSVVSELPEVVEARATTQTIVLAFMMVVAILLSVVAYFFLAWRRERRKNAQLLAVQGDEQQLGVRFIRDLAEEEAT